MSGANVKNRVSICCLGYKHHKFIKDNIEAIWKNKYNDIEIIAVDDGSNDGSVELLEKLALKSPYPMVIIAQENTGNVAKNFNTALKKATGEFIMFMSLDDVLYDDVVCKKANIMSGNSSIAFIASNIITGINDLGEVVHYSVPKLKVSEIDNPSLTDLIELEYNDFGSFYIQGTLFRKDVIDCFNGFDEDMIGDDIVLRCKLFKYLEENPQYSFLISDYPSCYYRMHDSNIHKNFVRQMKTVLEVLERFYSDRENPEVLFDWLKHTIKECSFDNYIQLFTHNKRATDLLLDDRVKTMIKKSLKKGKFTLLLEHFIMQLKSFVKKTLNYIVRLTA